MVLASGGSKAVQALLQKDDHFAEGVALWLYLIRQLSQEVTHADNPDEQFSNSFKDLVTVLLTDLELKFLAGAWDDSGAGEVYSSAVESAYMNGLQEMASLVYTVEAWAVPTLKTLEKWGPSKTFHQCILLLHSLIAMLIPDLEEMGVARAASPTPHAGGEVTHDNIAFIMPTVLASIRRHRTEAMNWLIIRPNITGVQLNYFKKILGIRKAFLRIGGLDRVLGVVDNCINKLEADEWPFCNLCINDKITFSGFGTGDHGYGAKAVEEATTMSEFVGSALVTFACTVSRGYVVNQVESLVDGGRDNPNRSLAERKAIGAYHDLAVLLYRMLRRTFPEMAGDDQSCVRKSYEILLFPLRFLISIAVGGYSPVVEQILKDKATSGQGATSRNNSPTPQAQAELNLRDSELHGPRALLLALELLFEYPVSSKEALSGVLKKLLSLLDFTKRLMRTERNTEIALDSGIVRALVWGATRPAAAEPQAESAILSLLLQMGRHRVTPAGLRTWLNAILYDYNINGFVAGHEDFLDKIEERRLNLLRALIDVANGCSDKPADYLSRSFGNIFGSAPIIAFDPLPGDDRSNVGPRLAIESLHPDGIDDANSTEATAKVKPWPPARGYTFSCWLYIQSFDKIRRLPLLSLVEDGENITTLDLVDGILSIWTGSGKESVVSLDRLPKLFEGQWWYLSIVHQKPRLKISGGSTTVTVSLQGGRWSQTCKLSFPRATAGLHRIKCLIGQARASSHPTKAKWYLGPTYLLSEPMSETQTSIHYAIGPSFSNTFVAEDGAGSAPLIQDICGPSQLRSILLNNKAEYRTGGADFHQHHSRTSQAATLRHPDPTQQDRSGGVRAQFTDLSAVPVESLGIQPDNIVFCLAPRKAAENTSNLEAAVAYTAGSISTLHVQLSGGAICVHRCRVADSVKWVCQLPMVPAIMLVERAATVEELRLSLEFLLALTHAHPNNLLQ